MRCYACDIPVNPKDSYDSPTKRYYCVRCMEATYDVLYSMELSDLGASHIAEEEPLEEGYYEIDIEDKEYIHDD